MHRQQLHNTAVFEPCALTAYEEHQSHSIESLCCKSTSFPPFLFLLKRPFIKRTHTLSVSIRKFPSMLLLFCRWKTFPSGWRNMREYMRSVAFKLHHSLICQKVADIFSWMPDAPPCVSSPLEHVFSLIVRRQCFVRGSAIASVWRVAGADVAAQSLTAGKLSVPSRLQLHFGA